MEIGLIQIVTLPIIFVSTFTRSTVGFGDAMIAMPLLTMTVGIDVATPLVSLVAVTISMTIWNFPPVLTPGEAARLLRIKVSTLYRHVSEGRYRAAVKRGKPLRFWRDRLIQEFMT